MLSIACGRYFLSCKLPVQTLVNCSALVSLVHCAVYSSDWHVSICPWKKIDSQLFPHTLVHGAVTDSKQPRIEDSLLMHSVLLYKFCRYGDCSTFNLHDDYYGNSDITPILIGDGFIAVKDYTKDGSSMKLMKHAAKSTHLGKVIVKGISLNTRDVSPHIITKDDNTYLAVFLQTPSTHLYIYSICWPLSA